MNENLALVFDGGGAKGAYQIGVWRALCESDLSSKVKNIAGSSVGGLNAALFVCGNGDYRKAEDIWINRISEIKIPRIQDAVSNIIDDCIDFEAFDRTDINCFLATTSTKSVESPIIEYSDDTETQIKKCEIKKSIYYNMRFYSKNDRNEFYHKCILGKEIMLATSALPFLCNPVKIEGNRLIDAGVSDNSPVRAISTLTDSDTAIVIHLDQTRYDIDCSRYPNMRILEIIPSESLGGFLKGTINFKKQQAKKLIEIGYHDAKPVFDKYKEMAKKAQNAKDLADRIAIYNKERILKSQSNIDLLESTIKYVENGTKG